MPLNKNALKSDIKRILKDLASRTENQEKAIDDYATALSDAIEKYVKSGLVVTSGSPTSHTGNIT